MIMLEAKIILKEEIILKVKIKFKEAGIRIKRG